MRSKIESRAAWIIVRIQIVIVNLDPELLQSPGGTLIALLLGLHLMARWFWTVATGGKAATRDPARWPKAACRPLREVITVGRVWLQSGGGCSIPGQRGPLTRPLLTRQLLNLRGTWGRWTDMTARQSRN